MLKFPQSIIYGMIAINITGFAFLLQMDMLVFNSLAAKIAAWICTAAIWALTYAKRKKYFTFF